MCWFVDDKVQDNDSCTAVDIKNEFISYFLMKEMSGEETCTESLQADSAILKLQNMQVNCNEFFWWVSAKCT